MGEITECGHFDNGLSASRAMEKKSQDSSAVPDVDFPAEYTVTGDPCDERQRRGVGIT
jgi:hypothetical protein